MLSSDTARDIAPDYISLSITPQPAQASNPTVTPPSQASAAAQDDTPRKPTKMAYQMSHLKKLHRAHYKIELPFLVLSLRYPHFAHNLDRKNPGWMINKRIMDIAWLQDVNRLYNRLPSTSPNRGKPILIKAIRIMEGLNSFESSKLRKYWVNKFCANTTKRDLVIMKDPRLDPADHFTGDALAVWTATPGSMSGGGGGAGNDTVISAGSSGGVENGSSSKGTVEEDDVADAFSKLTVRSEMNLDFPSASQTVAQATPAAAAVSENN